MMRFEIQIHNSTVEIRNHGKFEKRSILTLIKRSPTVVVFFFILRLFSSHQAKQKIICFFHKRGMGHGNCFASCELVTKKRK